MKIINLSKRQKAILLKNHEGFKRIGFNQPFSGEKRIEIDKYNILSSANISPKAKKPSEYIILKGREK